MVFGRRAKLSGKKQKLAERIKLSKIAVRAAFICSIYIHRNQCFAKLIDRVVASLTRVPVFSVPRGGARGRQ